MENASKVTASTADDALHVRHAPKNCRCNDGHANANGLKIAYETHGPHDAPVILLVHGLGVPLSGWPTELVDRFLDDGFRVVMFDNRDIGRSTLFAHAEPPNIAIEFAKSRLGMRVNTPYVLDDMMQDGVAVLDALNIERAHVVGASMGGMIAQLMAINAPDRVMSLTSIMSTTGDRNLPGPRSEIRRHILRRPNEDSAELRLQHGIKTWELIGSPGARRSYDETRQFLEGLYARGVTTAGVLRQMLAIIASPARSKALANVKLPALIIHGSDDPLVPLACGEATANALPDSTLRVLQGMGHDLPEQFLPDIARLIGEHAASADNKY